MYGKWMDSINLEITQEELEKYNENKKNNV